MITDSYSNSKNHNDRIIFSKHKFKCLTAKWQLRLEGKSYIFCPSLNSFITFSSQLIIKEAVEEMDLKYKTIFSNN